MSGERILVVENEKIIAIDLQRRLERFGYEVIGLTGSSQEAIAAARKHRPDLILMDIMLPGDLDGIETAKKIRTELDSAVVFLTAYSDEETLEHAKEADPFGYILKPFKEKELFSTIDIALYKHRVDNALKVQERWLSAILHSVADGIIATDVNNRVQFMNHAAQEITGWTEGQAKNLPIAEILRISDGERPVPLEILPEADGSAPAQSVVFEDSILAGRGGKEIRVEGTVSRIRDRAGHVEGQVVALRDTTMMQRMSETITYQASHDTLTGLENREQFSLRLGSLIESAQSSQATHALAYLDLDQFKVINDTCGHVAGDELLRQTTAIIKTVVRSTDHCARLGGDEFGLLLENINLEQAQLIAKRLQARINQHKFVWHKKSFSVSSSIGLVMIAANSRDIHTVLAAADDACYVAKDLGGNQVRNYEDNSSLFLRRRGEMEWISKLRRAVEENHFRLYYQPIVAIRDGQDRKRCEILLRLADAERIIVPADFIPAAERYNLMPTIDRWVIASSFDAYQRISAGDGELKEYLFSINLSGASLADDTLLAFLRSEFERTGVPPSAFCFEVTETAAIGNIASARRLIHNLKELGCTFALDDFGSGFSSFGYLKNLPIDFLKIDGSFVKDINSDPINRSMVEAINNLGKLMGVRTIAEYVADLAIMESLREIGVDYAQGYVIAAPTPLPEYAQAHLV